MPARVIRSEINSSQSLSRVSLMADHFFRALLLECDDFGRFDGRPPILKAALFPLREEYTPEAIEACVEELVSGDRPPLRVFHVDGRPYLLLTGWEKHRGKGKRAERSKYPDPPQESEPRKRSPRIPADPRGSDRGSARLTSDVLRLTSDDARLTTLGGSAEGGEPAAPAPTAEPVGLVVAGAPPKRKPRPRARLPVTPPPEVLAPADRERLIAWCERIYPDLGPELATISASTLDYWRGDGRMKADWLAVVRDRVRWTAERRGLRPRPPPAVAPPVDLSDPALGGQPLFADEVASG